MHRLANDACTGVVDEIFNLNAECLDLLDEAGGTAGQRENPRSGHAGYRIHAGVPLHVHKPFTAPSAGADHEVDAVIGEEPRKLCADAVGRTCDQCVPLGFKQSSQQRLVERRIVGHQALRQVFSIPAFYEACH